MKKLLLLLVLVSFWAQGQDAYNPLCGDIVDHPGRFFLETNTWRLYTEDDCEYDHKVIGEEAINQLTNHFYPFPEIDVINGRLGTVSYTFSRQSDGVHVNFNIARGRPNVHWTIGPVSRNDIALYHDNINGDFRSLSNERMTVTFVYGPLQEKIGDITYRYNEERLSRSDQAVFDEGFRLARQRISASIADEMLSTLNGITFKVVSARPSNFASAFPDTSHNVPAGGVVFINKDRRGGWTASTLADTIIHEVAHIHSDDVFSDRQRWFGWFYDLNWIGRGYYRANSGELAAEALSAVAGQTECGEGESCITIEPVWQSTILPYLRSRFGTN